MRKRLQNKKVIYYIVDVVERKVKRKRMERNIIILIRNNVGVT